MIEQSDEFLKVTPPRVDAVKFHPRTGELRTRVVFPNGHAKVNYTVASKGEPRWENTHLHKGLTELYIVLCGGMYIVWQDLDGTFLQKYLSAECSITIEPGVPHTVMKSPSAIILTTSFGKPVGNPERKDNDWWPPVNQLIETYLKELGPLKFSNLD